MQVNINTLMHHYSDTMCNKVTLCNTTKFYTHKHYLVIHQKLKHRTSITRHLITIVETC